MYWVGAVQPQPSSAIAAIRTLRITGSSVVQEWVVLPGSLQQRAVTPDDLIDLRRFVKSAAGGLVTVLSNRQYLTRLSRNPEG